MTPHTRTVPMLRGRSLFAAGVLGTGLLAATPLEAQNLLVNGSFASGPGGLDGWTTQTSDGYSFLLTARPWTCRLPNGIGDGCAVILTPGASTGFAALTQNIPTVVGERYRATVLLAANHPEETVRFRIGAGGQYTRSACDQQPLGTVCALSLFFTAQAAFTTVEFGVEGYAPPGLAESDYGRGSTFFDDARVVAAPEVLLTPEPATVALVAGGLLGLGGVARRRKSRQNT